MFTEKNEKAALDREWQQISQVLLRGLLHIFSSFFLLKNVSSTNFQFFHLYDTVASPFRPCYVMKITHTWISLRISIWFQIIWVLLVLKVWLFKLIQEMFASYTFHAVFYWSRLEATDVCATSVSWNVGSSKSTELCFREHYLSSDNKTTKRRTFSMTLILLPL